MTFSASWIATWEADMTEDEKYLRTVLEKIAQHERDKETQSARYRAHEQQERRKYRAEPEVITAFSELEPT